LHGEQVDLRDRFLPYATSPPIVRATRVNHVSPLVGNLLREVRIPNG